MHLESLQFFISRGAGEQCFDEWALLLFKIRSNFIDVKVIKLLQTAKIAREREFFTTCEVYVEKKKNDPPLLDEKITSHQLLRLFCVFPETHPGPSFH